MTNYFISRHAGAIEWAKQQGLHIDKQITHLEPDNIQAGDVVIGTLPVNLIAKINNKGGRYFHLSMDLPADARGKELTADDMSRYKARLEEYRAENLTT